ncbi:hypothetical protein [Fibrella aquatica]|uniref:hypothetical protein n=1 Tax=Fibrella aquatica TaxID=3242487 RepID=UPI00352199F3
MTRVSLEINELRIRRPKKRWKIYFVLVVEHPTNAEQMVVTVVPGDPIVVVPSQNNVIDFQGSRPDAEGLFLLSRTLPESRELNVHLYVRHSRISTRKAGDILNDIKDELGTGNFGEIADILGTTAVPWLAIAKSALPLIGKILQKIPDRDMGFVSLFERFSSEFEEEEEIDGEKIGGHINIIYSWYINRE